MIYSATQHLLQPRLQTSFLITDGLELAASTGNVEIFDWIFANGQASASPHARAIRIDAFRLAGEAGHLEIIRRLVDWGPISGDAPGIVLNHSIEKSRWDIVDLLVQHKLVSQKEIANALFNNVEGNNVEAVAILLRHATLSESDHEHLVIKAAECGPEAILQHLLSYQKPSQSALDIGIWYASRQGNESLVRQFLTMGSPSRESFKMAISAASRKGHTNIVDLLEKAISHIQDKSAAI